MPYPKMLRIQQHFEAPALDDIPNRIRSEIAGLRLGGRIQSGRSIAITVGSRGISNIALIIKTVVEELKAMGAEPFIVPAMGSHGGGTAEGQRAIVEGYGVTEAYVGAPIRATMEVVQVGKTQDGIPVFFDKYAYEADHVVVVGRVRPHTDFTGEIESGLHKMMLIGLGKHRGASVYHQAFIHYSFDRIIHSVGQKVLQQCGILFGLAIVENVNHQTGHIEAVPPEKFLERDTELLTLAKEWMPRLPFDRVDLLIVDQMGKNISGTGMDTNIVGRKYYVHYAAPDEYPKVTRLFVRDLTPETKGNATGLGMAEYTRTSLVDKIDYPTTYINCMTGNRPYMAAVPIHFETDRQVLDAALKTVGYVEPENAKVIRIRNTLELEEVLVSLAWTDEIHDRDDLEILAPAREMAFDAQGNLLPF
jgi:hypothetical protein